MPTEKQKIVTVFQSLDGETYDTLEQAQSADDKWKWNNEWTMEEEIKRFHRSFKKMQNSEKLHSQRNFYPKLVTWHDEHERKNWIAANDDGLLTIIWNIFREQMDTKYGYWANDGTEEMDPRFWKVALHVLAIGDMEAAFGMVMYRNHFKFDYELVTIRTIPMVSERSADINIQSCHN